MRKLKDCVGSSRALSEALQENGATHKNYKTYTSMERALGLLQSGQLYLFDGSKWNDTCDQKAMKIKGTFAKSFSWSTTENIAMWMLYGGSKGKKGAMLNFYPSTIEELMSLKNIDLGSFEVNGKFKVANTLSAPDDYKIFVTDVIYTEDCKNEKVKLTLGDDHITASKTVLDDNNIFCKKYPWSYERECRLVVDLSETWKEQAVRDKLNCVRLTISEPSLRRLRADRLIRSPIYSNGTDNGKPSLLTGDVEWDL